MNVCHLKNANVGHIAGNFGPVHDGHIGFLTSICQKFDLDVLFINLQNRLSVRRSRHGVPFCHSQKTLNRWQQFMQTSFKPNFRVIIFGSRGLSPSNNCKFKQILTNAEISNFYEFSRGLESQEDIKFAKSYSDFANGFCVYKKDTWPDDLLGQKTKLVDFIRYGPLSSTKFVDRLLSGENCEHFVPSFLAEDSDSYVAEITILYKNNLRICDRRWTTQDFEEDKKEESSMDLVSDKILTDMQNQLVERDMWIKNLTIYACN